MKSCNMPDKDGFTLVETMVATFIVLLALGMALTGFLYTVRSQNFTDVQNELDLDSQKAIERLKRDLRLSTLSEILYYPANPPTSGTFSAISFPLAYDDDGDGSVEVDSNARIIWDETVIYHMWIANPNPSELRVTRFRPRSTTATQAQRQTQLDNVVARGNGNSDCLGTERATTISLFQNLFTWQIRPRAATFDGYGPQFESTLMVDLGSYVLTSGYHMYKFKVVDKHPSSKGYYTGFDTLRMTPCSQAREAENYVTNTTGGLRREEMGGNLAWSANQHLFFGAVATNASFVMSLYNDMWQESRFYGADVFTSETVVNYKTNFLPRVFCVELDGMKTNWTAAGQSSDSTGAPASSNAYVGAAVRVLMRGSKMAEGGTINVSGGKCVVGVKAGSSALTIDKMWIAECANSDAASMDAKPGTMTQLRFAGGDGRSIPAGTTSETDEWGNMTIDRQKSYLVTMLVKNAVAQGSPHVWNDSAAMTSPGSYVISGNCNPDSVTASADSWSALPTNYVVTVLSNIVGVAYMRGTYAPSGTYVSAVCNTGIPNPAYASWALYNKNPGVGNVEIRFRSGSSPTMSDAGEWSAAPVVASGNSATISGALNLLPSRPYVQFYLYLTPSADTLSTPQVNLVNVLWPGQTRIVDIGGQFTRGPSNGIWEVTIDGNQLKSGIQIDMELYKDIRGFRKSGEQRLTSYVTSEVMPRNTGK